MQLLFSYVGICGTSDFLTQQRVPLDPFKIFNQETGFIKNLHIAKAQASLFLLCFWFSGWDTTSFYTSISAMGGTIVLDLQSSSCVHCQLFPPTHSNGPAAQPFSTGVHNHPPETTVAEANHATCLHQLNWAN